MGDSAFITTFGNFWAKGTSGSVIVRRREGCLYSRKVHWQAGILLVTMDESGDKYNILGLCEQKSMILLVLRRDTELNHLKVRFLATSCFFFLDLSVIRY